MNSLANKRRDHPIGIFDERSIVNHIQSCLASCRYYIQATQETFNQARYFAVVDFISHNKFQIHGHIFLLWKHSFLSYQNTRMMDVVLWVLWMISHYFTSICLLILYLSSIYYYVRFVYPTNLFCQ